MSLYDLNPLVVANLCALLVSVVFWAGILFWWRSRRK